jgi:hypothetical protein
VNYFSCIPFYLAFDVESILSSIQYLGQRKKIEAEEKRIKQKKAREEFTKMLEVC